MFEVNARVELIVHLYQHGDVSMHHKLDKIICTGEKLMALADDLKAGIAKLDAETNANAAAIEAVQANITQLAGRIKNTMTDQEVADIQAALGVQSDKLTAESDRLKTLAVDPTNPVPPVPAALAQARKK